MKKYKPFCNWRQEIFIKKTPLQETWKYKHTPQFKAYLEKKQKIYETYKQEMLTLRKEYQFIRDIQSREVAHLWYKKKSKAIENTYDKSTWLNEAKFEKEIIAKYNL